jgi:hypothetical protein
MQPATAEASICQGHENTDSGKVCISFGLVGRAVCEGADASILFMDEVNEIRIAIMEARRERLVFDYAVQFNYKR